jgi:glycosyltransferase involved in cell wall biosynthesis
VDDIRPYLEGAGIFVCPIRYGAGIKNKILAALSMNKAVVATRMSIEGLDLQDNEHLIIADEPEKFAAQVVRLLEDPQLVARLGRNGQAMVSAGYSWQRSASQLEDVLLAATGSHPRIDGSI